MGAKVVERTLRYIKKSIPVEAIQWTGDNFDKVRKFMSDSHIIVTTYNELIISTLEGNIKVPKENWIIRDPMGEYYTLRREVFEEIYEPVEE